MKARLDPNRCSKILRALGDPERLRIVQMLQEGPRSVSDIARHLRTPIANVSHHLKQLRISGLIRGEKRGRTVVYAISPGVVEDTQGVFEFGSFRLELGAKGLKSNRTKVAKPRLAPKASGTRVVVVNSSFEQPRTDFVATQVTGWMIAGPPDTGIAGVFANQGVSDQSPAHIDNADGRQLAFISTDSGNELWQILKAKFKPGFAYRLTLGVATSYALPPRRSDCLRVALFHPDGDGRRVLAQLDVVNDSRRGLSSSTLSPFSVQTPLLIEPEPAIGKPIGISIAAVGEIGGYFNLDAVTVHKCGTIDEPPPYARNKSQPAAVLQALLPSLRTRKR